MDQDSVTGAAAADPEPAPAPAPAVQASSIAPETVEPLIERWWQDHFPGSAVAADTRAWNVAHAAKEDLKARFQALIQQPSDKE